MGQHPNGFHSSASFKTSCFSACRFWISVNSSSARSFGLKIKLLGSTRSIFLALWHESRQGGEKEEERTYHFRWEESWSRNETHCLAKEMSGYREGTVRDWKYLTFLRSISSGFVKCRHLRNSDLTANFRFSPFFEVPPMCSHILRAITRVLIKDRCWTRDKSP